MKFIVATLPIFTLVNSLSLFQSDDQKTCKVVNGGWGPWGDWHPCSVTCGSGIQKRYRHCDSPRPLFHGKKCVGDHSESRQCDSGRKCPVDGGWGDWKVEGCSVTCGKGEKVYKRTCDSPRPEHCGELCSGETEKVEECVMPPCKVDCEWSDWKCGACLPDTCKKDCTRTIKTKAKHGGKECEGNSKEQQKCKTSDGSCDNIPIPFEGCKECSQKGSGMLACRVEKAACHGKKLGIRKMYPANGHYFLHCSDDGPWCKPCAVKTLVYNARCGQCEATPNGECTGPRKWVRELEDEELW